jgi:hypothetical protein
MSQEWMTVNSKTKRIWKEAVVEYFMIISRCFLRLKKLPGNLLQEPSAGSSSEPTSPEN